MSRAGVRLDLTESFALRASSTRFLDRQPWLALALAVSVSLNVILIATQSVPPAILRAPGGSLSYLATSSQPVLGDARILRWAQDVVTNAYTFDVSNFDRRLDENGVYFLPDARVGFKAALANSGITKKVQDTLAVVTCVPSAPPVMLQHATFSGAKLWKAQLPVAVTFRSSRAPPETMFLVVTLVVTSRPTSVEPSGLAVSGFVAVSHDGRDTK